MNYYIELMFYETFEKFRKQTIDQFQAFEIINSNKFLINLSSSIHHRIRSVFKILSSLCTLRKDLSVIDISHLVKFRFFFYLYF